MNAPPAPVRLGFLGAGLIARYHAGSLRAAGCLGSGRSGPAPGGAPAAVLTGVFDPDGERAEQFAHAHGTIVRRSLEIAASIDVFTNTNIAVEVLPCAT